MIAAIEKQDETPPRYLELLAEQETAATNVESAIFGMT